MPMAAALVASAFSVSSGMAAIGAAGGLMTGGGLLGGLMVAGGALSGIGAITGNSKLLKIGAVMGLAGGVGSMISKGLETSASAAGTAAAEGAKSTAGQTVADLTGTATGATETASLAAEAAGDIATADAGLVNSAMGAPTTGAPIAGADPSAAGLGGVASNPLDARLAAGTAGTQGGGSFWDKLGASVSDNASSSVAGKIGNAASTVWDGAKGVMGDVSSWAEKNPNTAKLGAGLVGGAMSYVGQSEAMKRQMAEKKKYDQWVAQRYNASVANLQIPSPLSTPGQQPGIIAGSRG